MMISTHWQTAIALTCVGLAAAYIARRIWRALGPAGSDGCHGCHDQPVTGIKQTPIVTVDSLRGTTPSQSTAQQGEPNVRYGSEPK